MSVLEEKDVGIIEYLSPAKGCGGIIKMRYSDFLVNEVNLQGGIVKFDSDAGIEKFSKAVEKKAVSKDVLKDESLETSKNELLSKLPESCAIFSKDEIDSMALMSVDKKSKTVLTIQAHELDKMQRTQAHVFVRNFPNLASNTKQIEGKTVMEVFRSREGCGQRKDKKTIYKFVMYKENIATSDALQLICKKLKFNNNKGLNITGNKDKRGITVQEVTTTFPPQRMIQINDMLKFIKVGNFRPCNDHFRLGELQGNLFTIILRNVNVDESSLKEACSNLEKNGFINYFGMQRFGTGKVPTYDLGKEILRKNWAKVVDLVLSACFDEVDEATHEKLKNWKEARNAADCIDRIGRKFYTEVSLLKGLRKFGCSQPMQALNSIPHNIRKLYLHSYQSYVWNRMVSKRISKYSLKVVIGDLVKIERDLQDTASDDGPAPKKAKIDSEASVGEYERPPDANIKRVTAEDVEKYSISQVVLPLPGCDVIYPKYEGEECWYKQMVQGDGMKMTDFGSQTGIYYLSGDYRSIISHVKNLKYEVIRYNDYTQPLMQTDYEKLKKKPQPIKVEDGKYHALKICFQLPASSYATVALRDITKNDLSPPAQMKLEKVHKFESKSATVDPSKIEKNSLTV